MAAGRRPRCSGRPGRAATADSLFAVRFDTNDYSSDAYAHHKVMPSGRSTRSGSVVGDRVGGEHRRCWTASGHLRPGPLPGLAGAQARGWTSRRPWRVGASDLLRRAPPSPRGRVRRAGDAAVHQGAAAPGVGQPAGPDPGGGAGLGAGSGRRRRGAADPGARPGRPAGGVLPDGRPHLSWLGVPAPDLSAYASLTAGVDAMSKHQAKSTGAPEAPLKALKLPTMHASVRRWPPAAPRENVDHLGFLLQLCERELLEREAGRPGGG